MPQPKERKELTPEQLEKLLKGAREAVKKRGLMPDEELRALEGKPDEADTLTKIIKDANEREMRERLRQTDSKFAEVEGANMDSEKPAPEPVSDTKGQVLDQLRKGDELVKGKKYNDARTIYGAVIKATDDDRISSLAYYGTGVSYHKEGHLDDAIKCYTRSLSYDSSNVDALFGRVAARSNSGDFLGTIAEDENVMNANPRHEHFEAACDLIANAYRAVGKPEDEIVFREKQLEKYRADPDLTNKANEIDKKIQHLMESVSQQQEGQPTPPSEEPSEPAEAPLDSEPVLVPPEELTEEEGPREELGLGGEPGAPLGRRKTSKVPFIGAAIAGAALIALTTIGIGRGCREVAEKPPPPAVTAPAPIAPAPTTAPTRPAPAKERPTPAPIAEPIEAPTPPPTATAPAPEVKWTTLPGGAITVPEGGATIKWPKDETVNIELPGNSSVAFPEKTNVTFHGDASLTIGSSAKVTLPGGTRISRGGFVIDITEEGEVQLFKGDVVSVTGDPLELEVPANTTASSSEGFTAPFSEGTTAVVEGGAKVDVPAGTQVSEVSPKAPAPLEEEKPPEEKPEVTVPSDILPEVDKLMGGNKLSYGSVDDALKLLQDSLKSNRELAKDPQYWARMGVVLGCTGQTHWGDIRISEEAKANRVTALACMNHAVGMDSSIADQTFYGVPLGKFRDGTHTYLTRRGGLTSAQASALDVEVDANGNVVVEK